MKIKICGVTRTDDAVAAVRAGADFIGINFWPRSKRYVDTTRGAELARAVRDAGGRAVGVFVDASTDEIAAIAEHLDIVQLHGDESPADIAAIVRSTRKPVWKALAVRGDAELDSIANLDVDAILLDTPTAGKGGSGMTFDWSLARAARTRFPAMPLVLAGGLSPENVASAIAEVTPWAVDVASGVEATPGVKDVTRVTAFIAAARSAQLSR